MKKLLLTIIIFLSFASTAHGATLIDKSEPVTITIGSGQTSNTATLGSTYDTTRSGIYNEGTNISAAQNVASSSLASLYFTNGTTITAVRGGASTLATITVKADVVQWASGVTNSVQRGETFTQAGILTATTTLGTPVTKANAYINMLGSNSTSTAQLPIALFRNSVQAGDGTNVNVTRGVSTDGATSTWQVTEFVSGVLASAVQEVLITIANTSATQTATISSVNTSYTMLFNGGITHATITSVAQSLFPTVGLTSGTVVTADRTGTVGVGATRVSVVEFNPSYLKQNIQSGTIVMASGATSNTATVSSVDTTRSLVSWMGTRNNVNSPTNFDRALSTIERTNATTLTVNRTSGTSAIATSTYFLLESAVSTAYYGHYMLMSMPF